MCQNRSVARRIKPQRWLAPERRGAGRGEGATAQPGTALLGHRRHPQQVSLNNHPGYNLPPCAARQGGKVTSWAAGSFQTSQGQKPWQNPIWHTCWASIAPACSLGARFSNRGELFGRGHRCTGRHSWLLGVPSGRAFHHTSSALR